MIFVTCHRNVEPDALAPDGSQVRILANTARGSMAEFLLPPGKISIAVAHHTVEEVWFFTQGQGQLWRKNDVAEEIIEILPGLSISIPIGTHFQFRNDSTENLKAIGTTMPPWPGAGEAYTVKGKW
jgi:mannose-6-phosphate isomerase-like protein (cupin superfamily)